MLLKAYFMLSFNKIVKKQLPRWICVFIKISPKRILSLCLVFAIGISMGVLSDHFVSENSRFQTFTEKLFQSEVCSNTLTLHYTLAHPEKKGIRKPEATLGTALSDPAKTTSLCQEYEKELKSFAYSRLSEENRLTCDMLLLYFHTRASLGKKQHPG